MKRKFAATLLACALLAVTLTGCGGSETGGR